MYDKYVNSIPGTKEYTFYTFFAAYVTQDIESIDEAISDFEHTATEDAHKELVDSINEFLSSDYPEDNKADFINELSSGWIEAKTYNEQLKFIRDSFKK